MIILISWLRYHLVLSKNKPYFHKSKWLNFLPAISIIKNDVPLKSRKGLRLANGFYLTPFICISPEKEFRIGFLCFTIDFGIIAG